MYIICENLEKEIRTIHYKLSEIQQAKVVHKTKLAKVLMVKSHDIHNNNVRHAGNIKSLNN